MRNEKGCDFNNSLLNTVFEMIDDGSINDAEFNGFEMDAISA